MGGFPRAGVERDLLDLRCEGSGVRQAGRRRGLQLPSALAEGEKYFNKTAPQPLNATTLPPEFSIAAGHQLPGSLVIPLSSFPAGDYRLEIKVTDKPSGGMLTRA